MLYELLAQRRPFPGETREEVLSQILTKDPRPPRRFNPRVPVDLETIALKALEKDPDRRYASAGELAHDLRQYLGGGLIKARRATMARRAWKAMRRHPVVSTVAVAVLVIGLLVGFGWGAVTRLRVARLVSEAQLLTERGEYRKGLGLAEEALRIDPDNVEARLRRALTLILAERYTEAVEDARGVLRTDPDDWVAHTVMATAAKCCNPSIDVAAHVAAVERLAPDTADAFFLRARLADSSREAIEWLDRALELDPGHVLAIRRRALEHSKLKDLPAALADAERMLAVRPRGALGHVLVSFVRSGVHDDIGALEAAERAVELAPEESLGFYIRADVHAKHGRRDAAIADVTRAIEMDPDVPRYLDWRGFQHLIKEDYESAIADFERALELNPELYWASLNLASAYWDSGREEDARAVVQELTARAETWHDEEAAAFALQRAAEFYWGKCGEPETALELAEKSLALAETLSGHREVVRARRQLERDFDEACDRMAGMELDSPRKFDERAGYMRRSCHRDDQALADYARAIELAPSWAEPFLERARLYLDLDDADKALDDLDKAVELAPSWDRALIDRHWFFFGRERFEEALADIERLVERGRDDRGLRWRRARALLRLGRDAEALAVFDRRLEESPADGDALRDKVDALVLLGRTEQAVAALDVAIEADPASAGFYLARARYATFLAGGCARAAEDLATYRSLSEDEASTWDDLACVHTEFYPLACPDLADPTAALDLARRAVAADETNLGFRYHLAAAAYRAGHYETARDALSAVIEESRIVYPQYSFFLAMTLRRLGDRTGAREWYERGVARMERTFPDHPLVVSLKREAAELLGIGPS